MNFVEDSRVVAELVATYLKAGGEEHQSVSL